MYGRCETDPFDQAVDVCGSCYGEFCSTCLVATKGRKHRICKECALIASGVRPGSKPLIRGSKKTADARRKALREAPPAEAPLQFYDGPTEPGGKVDQMGTRGRHGETVDHEAALPPLPPLGPAASQIGASSDADQRPRSAIEQLEEMTHRGPDDAVSEPPAAPAPSRPVPISHPVAPVDELAEMPDLTVNPFAGSSAPTRPTRSPGPPPALTPIVPERRSANPLPRRRSTTSQALGSDGRDGRDGEETAGAVATADRPTPPLPRRRSKLRPDGR